MWQKNQGFYNSDAHESVLSAESTDEWMSANQILKQHVLASGIL